MMVRTIVNISDIDGGFAWLSIASWKPGKTIKVHLSRLPSGLKARGSYIMKVNTDAETEYGLSFDELETAPKPMSPERFLGVTTIEAHKKWELSFKGIPFPSNWGSSEVAGGSLMSTIEGIHVYFVKDGNFYIEGFCNLCEEHYWIKADTFEFVGKALMGMMECETDKCKGRLTLK